MKQASLQLGSTKVVLVDTPGFNDTDLEDEDVYYLLTDWIKETHEQGRKFSGLLYLHPINKTREKGSDVRSLKIFKRLVGNTNFSNVVIGMTFCDVEDPEVVASREQTLRDSPEFWGDMVAAGATVTRISADNTDECMALVAQMAGQNTMTLQVEKELFEENKSAVETSGMQEMPHHDEIKEIRLREEIQLAAQKMLYDERVKLTTQFAAERAALEQKLFEERQAKQLIEEELLTWKLTCEKEKEENEALKWQYQLEEDLRKQKVEQQKKEAEAREMKAKMAEDDRLHEEREDKEYAKRQIQKTDALVKSQMAVFRKFEVASNAATRQSYAATLLNKGGIRLDGIPCELCWCVLPGCEPFLGRLICITLLFIYPQCDKHRSHRIY